MQIIAAAQINNQQFDETNKENNEIISQSE